MSLIYMQSYLTNFSIINLTFTIFTWENDIFKRSPNQIISGLLLHSILAEFLITPKDNFKAISPVINLTGNQSYKYLDL
jgi:hypothetical protein